MSDPEFEFSTERDEEISKAHPQKWASAELVREARDNALLEEKLNRARAHYYGKEAPQGDQLAAEWLVKTRSVKTDRHGKIYVYDREAGHYKAEGETLLKADLVKAFSTLANRRLVGEVLAKVQALSYCDPDVLSKTTPPNLIPLENGIYDLHTGKLLSHSHEYFFTYKHPVTYNPNAECTLVHKFLEEIVPNGHDKDILLDIAALCIYRERITPHFFVFVGGGRNGKSLLLNLYKSFIGKNRVVSITPQAFADDVFAPAQLHDKHANLGADIPGGVIRDIAIVKNATGGDTINVQRKGVDREERDVYCEFVWASNDPPRITEDTTAIWERLVVVMFPFTFIDSPTKPHEKVADQHLGAQLITQNELSGLFNEVIKRLPNIMSRRKLNVPVQPEQTRKQYRSLSDTPAVFVDEACEEVDYDPSSSFSQASGYITADEAYRAYKSWCKENRAVPVSSNRFGRAMENLGYERGKDNQQRSYRGLSLKNKQAVVTEKEAPLTNFTVTQYEIKTIQNASDLYTFLKLVAPKTISFEEILNNVTPDISNAEEFLTVRLRALAHSGNAYENPSGFWGAL